MPIGAQFVHTLEEALHLRRIQAGIDLLSSEGHEIEALTPETPDGGRLLLLIAQWIDAGFSDYRLLQPLVERFPADQRRQLNVRDYLSVRMAGAFVDLMRGELYRAIEGLESALRTCQDLEDRGNEALAHFWLGRAHRKKGEYEIALQHIVRAQELASENDRYFAAVVQIQKSWLLFQKGLTRDAEQMLNCAESVLSSTDHYVALANIESARGRIVRRAGEYSKALEHFARAVEIYAKRDPNHVNLARSLVNAAYVRRLVALQLRKQIDTQAYSGRNPNTAGNRSWRSREVPLLEYQKIWQKAVDDLTKAREIYWLRAHFDGIGKVSLSLSYLHLDRGDIEQAAGEAEEAYRIGREQQDQILMARARILESAIENAHVEEQTGEGVDVAVHANRAKQYSEEAIALAHNTQNLRLLAGAWIARGTTAANEFFQDWETARQCASEATALIGPGESDHLVEDLTSLKTKIVRASGINDILRSWSEGIIGNKTFQQIVEEFAEIVIPKVWLREHKKISRVAAVLSISPKKVRRILRNTGSLR